MPAKTNSSSAAGWDNESWNGNNASGFSLIPAGYISSSGSSGGSQSYLWSQSVRDIYYPANWNWFFDHATVNLICTVLDHGVSRLLYPLRCVSVGSGCMDADACNYDATRQMPTAAACDYSCQESCGSFEGQRPVSRPDCGHRTKATPIRWRRSRTNAGSPKTCRPRLTPTAMPSYAPADADDWCRLRPVEGTGTVTTRLSVMTQRFFAGDVWPRSTAAMRCSTRAACAQAAGCPSSP